MYRANNIGVHRGPAAAVARLRALPMATKQKMMAAFILQAPVGHASSFTAPLGGNQPYWPKWCRDLVMKVHKSNSERYRLFCFLFINGYPPDYASGIVMWWQRKFNLPAGKEEAHMAQLIGWAKQGQGSVGHFQLTRNALYDMLLQQVTTPVASYDEYREHLSWRPLVLSRQVAVQPEFESTSGVRDYVIPQWILDDPWNPPSTLTEDPAAAEYYPHGDYVDPEGDTLSLPSQSSDQEGMLQELDNVLFTSDLSLLMSWEEFVDVWWPEYSGVILTRDQNFEVDINFQFYLLTGKLQSTPSFLLAAIWDIIKGNPNASMFSLRKEYTKFLAHWVEIAKSRNTGMLNQ